MRGFIELLMRILTLFVGNAKSSQVETPKKAITPKPPETPVKPIEEPKETPKFGFKTDSPRFTREILELNKVNKDLYNILCDVNEYCYKNFGKTVIITMIYRTQEEQDLIYRNNPKYKKRKFKSPHQFFHGLGLRSRTFTTSEIEKVTNYLNNKYNETNYYKPTAMCHNVGHGDHWHLQYIKK